MSTHKYIDKICVVAAILSLTVMLMFMNGKALGIQAASGVMGYEERLFNTAEVHTIDIVMDDWESFIETCENEEYAACSVIIDGEAYKNVGIRAKGNTSLSTVSSLGSDRYSFKIEFDQYDSTKSYHGLDKLSLNNLIQDNTMMKDYLTYQMMGQFGAAAPLCSYAYITVNDEDWGLYLAVEGVEESFLKRNYGSDYGDLYKPDSMDMGGGRGNGREFNMEDFTNTENEEASSENSTAAETGFSPEIPGGGADIPAMPGEGAAGRGGFGGNAGGAANGMGSDEVKLQYIDDDTDSYSTIFSSAKTDITQADMDRLIESLKLLSEGENIEDAVDIEQVIRYFVVHNFVVNGDSYTGSMIHNYYLYEEDGLLSMLPWDYNLAFGGFQSHSAADTVNDPIDTPLSVTGNGDRPMADWIFSNKEYTELYHQYFKEFLESVDFTAMIDSAAELIAPYVEKDPSKFCTYEEFKTGVVTLREFCLLRAESVRGQLDGTIPATSQGQQEDASSLVDASHITISDMGSMNMGGRGDLGNAGDRNMLQGGFRRGDAMTGRAEAGEDIAQNDTEDGTADIGGQSLGSPPEQGFGEEMPVGQPQFPGEMQPGQNADGQMSENIGESFPPDAVSGGEGASRADTWILLGVSALVLVLGLAAALKFKR